MNTAEELLNRKNRKCKLNFIFRFCLKKFEKGNKCIASTVKVIISFKSLLFVKNYYITANRKSTFLVTVIRIIYAN